mmetsp:Transcript_43233/g.100194  ORF Transcript_43233/g.100194 Transcript_43233/m.100194 type:complete len:308 (-) Transcript_43233:108-1031(-)
MLAVCTALLLSWLRTVGSLRWGKPARHIEVGNILAGLSWPLLESEECGHNPRFVVEREPGMPAKWDAFDELFGLPLVSVANETAACVREDLRDTSNRTADFPPWNITRSLFRRRLFPLLKQQKLLATRRELLRQALVVHLRGGDVMPRQDVDYLPAPCTFVDRVIRAGREGGLPYEHIVMVSDSDDHPCIGYLKIRHPQAYFRQNRAIHDFHTLISAQNVVLSTSSTFGLAATFLNPGKDLRIFLPTYSGRKLCCEGNFNPSRLDQLCQVSRLAEIWEFNALEFHGNRTAWILDDRHVKNLTVHKCS